MFKIASGAYGNVFVKKSKRRINVVKKLKTKTESGKKINVSGELSHECVIARKIRKIDPSHVIRITKCTNRNMRMNFHKRGTVEQWLINKPPSLTDRNVMAVTRQVLKTLANIHAADPSFRHNDLHGGNILLSAKLSPIISDFGLACDSQYKNKLLTPWMKSKTGAYPGSHYMYDAHTFLNFLYIYIRSLSLQRRLPKTFAYLKRYLSVGLAGNRNATYIKGMRLRPGVKFPYTYADLLKTTKKTNTRVQQIGHPTNEAWKKAQVILRNVATIKKM